MSFEFAALSMLLSALRSFAEGLLSAGEVPRGPPGPWLRIIVVIDAVLPAAHLPNSVFASNGHVLSTSSANPSRNRCIHDMGLLLWKWKMIMMSWTLGGGFANLRGPLMTSSLGETSPVICVSAG